MVVETNDADVLRYAEAALVKCPHQTERHQVGSYEYGRGAGIQVGYAASSLVATFPCPVTD